MELPQYHGFLWILENKYGYYKRMAKFITIYRRKKEVMMTNASGCKHCRGLARYGAGRFCKGVLNRYLIMWERGPPDELSWLGHEKHMIPKSSVCFAICYTMTLMKKLIILLPIDTGKCTKWYLFKNVYCIVPCNCSLFWGYFNFSPLDTQP